MNKFLSSHTILLKLHNNSENIFISVFSLSLLLPAFLLFGDLKFNQKESFSKEGQRELKVYSKGLETKPDAWDLNSCLVTDYKYNGAYLASEEPTGEKSSTYMIDGISYVHPVVTAQYALFNFNNFFYNKDLQYFQEFIDTANYLLHIQKPNGALEYGFEYKDYVSKTYFKPGWISCMAQGEVISVFARAFNMTKDYKYYEGAKKAYLFMFTSKENGGCLTTLEDLDSKYSKDIFLEEYISYPKNHFTLNGYMFSMIGVYDFLKLTEEEGDNFQYLVKEDFHDLVNSLKIVLPYYDLANLSSYDLAHITMPEYRSYPDVSAKYHRVHICQLNLLFSITGDQVIMKYRNKFVNYIL